jgi:hypothetical protein
MFSFGNVPWLNNVRNAVDNAVHEISNAADTFANNLQHGNRQTRRQRGGGNGNPAAHQQTAQEVPPSSRRTPVASQRAIRQIPTIRVAPEDLVEPSNRECCICLEE